MKTSRILAILLGMTLLLSVVEIIILRTDPARTRHTGQNGEAGMIAAGSYAVNSSAAGSTAASSSAEVEEADADKKATEAGTASAERENAAANAGAVEKDDAAANMRAVDKDAAILLTGYPDTHEIALVNVENQQGSYLVMNSSEGYRIRSFDTQLIDQQEADRLFQAAANIRAERMITEQAAVSQLEAFGLLSPACSLLYMDLEKRGFSLLIGNKIPEMDACYGMIEGTKTVYAIPASLTDQLLLPVSKYLDLRVLPEFSGINASSDTGDTEASGTTDGNNGSGHTGTIGYAVSDITALTILNPERTVFSLKRTRVSAYGGSAFYAMTEPVTLYPDWEVLRQLLFDPLCTLEGDSLAEDHTEENLNEEGISEEISSEAELTKQTPAWTILLEVPDRSIRIHFYENTDHSFTVQRSDNPAAYHISAEALPFLSLDVGTLLGGTLLRENAVSIRRIQVSSQGHTAEYEVNISGSDWQATRDGELLGSQTFLEVLNALNHIYLQQEIGSGQTDSEQTGSELTGPSTGDGSVYAVLSVEYQETTEKEALYLEFYETDSRIIIVSVNGIPAFTILKTTLTGLLEQVLY